MWLDSVILYIVRRSISYVLLCICGCLLKAIVVIFELLSQEEFYSWLKYHKEKWRLQLTRRHERKSAANRGDFYGDSFDHTTPRLTGGLTGFLRQQNRTLVDLPWQIIQVNFSKTIHTNGYSYTYLPLYTSVQPFFVNLKSFLRSEVFCVY